MQFVLKIESDHEAMVDMPELEVAEILRYVTRKLADGYREAVLHDINGNPVGSWKLVTS